MAVSADGRLSLSSAIQLRGSTGLAGRNWKLVKFCNGELMGQKLKLAKVQQQGGNGVCTKNVKQHICMSLTADVTSETKLRDLDLERRDPRTVVAVILGGGAGTRLIPLTKRRAKPAVPIGGAYRPIDVPMSNCIDSGINKVYILTQFNSAGILLVLTPLALESPLEMAMSRFLQPLKLQGRLGRTGFRVLQMLRASSIGSLRDHLYRMDYMDFVQNHRQSNADITLSCLPMDDSHRGLAFMMQQNQRLTIARLSIQSYHMEAF